MSKKRATREAYGETLAALGAKYPELVVLDADLSGSTKSGDFAKLYPERFYNMGIAECNMIGTAAGLAAAGKKPFASSFAMFTSGRAFEQIRNSVAYPRLNVKCIGSHGGLSVGEDGATHQCLEDFAVMNSIAGMLVLCPCDAYEMKCAIEALIEYDGPAYVRLGRMAVESVTEETLGYSFELGKGAQLCDGKDLSFIACGLMVQEALKAAEILSKERVSARVIDMHTIKPIDGEIIKKAAFETGLIITAEEHNIHGGLGSQVASYASENCPVRVLRCGVEDEFGRSGKPEEVLEHFGLTAEALAEKARYGLKLKDK